jgi:hypothetical protein
LNRLGGPLVFNDHPNIKDITPLSETKKTFEDGDILKIDEVLKDVFGYPAFVCLLAGIMTFAEDSSQSLGFRIDFLKHSNVIQSKLLKDFVGRALNDQSKKAITQNILTQMGLEGREKFWTSLFVFGFNRKQMVTPTNSYFIENYFRTFNPEFRYDYQEAISLFLSKSYSQYMGELKKVYELNKMNLEGRQEIFNFLNSLLLSSLESVDLKHSGQETWLVNQLMKYTISPTAEANDLTRKLLFLQTKHKSTSIRLGTGLVGHTAPTVAFEVSLDTLENAFESNKLTVDTLYTWLFSYESIQNRITSTANYYNDFNIVWNSDRDGKEFNERFYDAYKALFDMIDMVPKTADLKVELYARTENGIDRNLDITTKPEGIQTDFKVHEIRIDPSNPSEAIISLLFWVMMEPNIFSVIKWNGNNLAYLDIYNMFGQDHVDSGAVAPGNRIQGSFVWTEPEGTGTFTPSKYQEFMDEFKEAFEYGDIMHFLGFHNHELDSDSDNIIDYTMDKVHQYFVKLGVIDKDSEIIELR